MEEAPLFMDWKNHTGKMVMLHKAIYRFKAIAVKIPMAFFKDTEQQQQQSSGLNRTKDPKSLRNPENKESWRAALPDTVPPQAAITGTAWPSQESGHTDRWDRAGAQKYLPWQWARHLKHTAGEGTPLP